MEWRNWVAAAALCLCVDASFAAPTPPAFPSQDNVIDLAGAISPATAVSLGGILRGYRQATDFDMTVITVAELDGESLDAYARRALHDRLVGDEDAGVVLLLWAPTQEFIVAASPAVGAYLSQEQIAGVLDTHAPQGLTADNLGAGLIQVISGLMMAVQQTSDSPSLPGEIVFATQWDMPVGDADLPEVTRTLEEMQAPALSDSPAAPRAEGRATSSWIERLSDPSAALTTARAQGSLIYVHVQDWFDRVQHAVEDSANPEAVQRLTEAVVVAVLLIVGLLVLLGAWRASRSPGFVVSLMTLAAAAVLWVLTDFVELAVLTLIVGQLAWMSLVLLPHLFARQQDARMQVQSRVVSGPGLARSITAPGKMPAAASQKVASAAPRPVTTPPAARQPSRESASSRSPQDLLDLARRQGVATPALDHLIRQREAMKTPQLQAQRRNWLIAIGVSFFIMLPVALGLALVWAVSELNRLKPAGQALPAFLGQLVREMKALGQLRQQ